MAVERRILDRAPGVLARDTKATVADFARAAGVSRASFYRHFKSREALLDALDVTPEPGARERILTAAVESKRLQMIIKPAWDPATRKSITDIMERAVKAGFYEKMPDEKIIYAP